MRLIASADVHGSLDVYRWLVSETCRTGADLLVIAGDLFGGGDAVDHREQAEQIISELKMCPSSVFYLMGNDDFTDLDYEDEQIKPIDQRRVEAGGFLFVGYQYTPPFIGGIHEKPEEEMVRDLARLEPWLTPQSIFVTHGPSFGVLDRTSMGENAGSRALAAALARRHVLAHIHGHIHESFGRHGNAFNVASARQHRAILLELPELRHTVLQCHRGTEPPRHTA